MLVVRGIAALVTALLVAACLPNHRAATVPHAADEDMAGAETDARQ
ncbi:hypothetical protein [Streptomyces albogriseolus]